MLIIIINFGWIRLMSIILFILTFIISYSNKIIFSSFISSFFIDVLSISSFQSLQLIFCTHGPTHGPLSRYVKFRVAHAPGMPGTFSPAADFKGNRKLAIPTCITARAWRTCRDACRDRAPAVTGKTFPAFTAHAHQQFCVSGKRPMPSFSVFLGSSSSMRDS